MIALPRIFYRSPIGPAGDPEGAASQRPRGVGPIGRAEYFSLVYGVRKWRISGVDTTLLPYEESPGWNPDSFERGTWEVEITPQKTVYLGEEPNPTYDPTSPTDPEDPDYVEEWATEFIPVYELVPIEQGEEFKAYEADAYPNSSLSLPTSNQPSGWLWEGFVPVYGDDGGTWEIFVRVMASWAASPSAFTGAAADHYTTDAEEAFWFPFVIQISSNSRPPIPVWENTGTSSVEDATTGTLTIGATELSMHFRITNSASFQLPGHYRVANAEAIEWWSYGGRVNTETGAQVLP
jgi:hypothetical protein